MRWGQWNHAENFLSRSNWFVSVAPVLFISLVQVLFFVLGDCAVFLAVPVWIVQGTSVLTYRVPGMEMATTT